MAQWQSIHLPMQEIMIWALIWEDPTWPKAFNPLPHNYWASAPSQGAKTTEHAAHAAATEDHEPRACALQQEKPPQWEAQDSQWETSPCLLH